MKFRTLFISLSLLIFIGCFILNDLNAQSILDYPITATTQKLDPLVKKVQRLEEELLRMTQTSFTTPEEAENYEPLIRIHQRSRNLEAIGFLEYLQWRVALLEESKTKAAQEKPKEENAPDETPNSPAN
jgi:hypothetical protein